MRTADKKRLEGNARWRGSNPRYLAAEVSRHMERGRTPTEIAIWMGIRISVVMRTISGLSSTKKQIDGSPAEK